MTKTMTDEEADKLLKKKIELVGELTELYEEFFGKEEILGVHFIPLCPNE